MMTLSEPIATLLGADEVHALRVMRQSFGVDVMKTFQFWEAMVARIVAGRLTAHKCGWDVEIDCEEAEAVRVEVKHSAEFMCRFRSGTRPVFKFANPKGLRSPKAAHAIVLLGIDSNSDLHAWVLPPHAIGLVASITLTSPSHLTGTATRTFPMDEFRCPPTQILPEVLRVSRDVTVYDRQHHNETAYHTRRARAGTAELF